jgi:hypothetical protein
MMPTRRAFLRGAGALVALPFLESLIPAAEARPPLRLGIVTVTGGTVLESWKPKEAGPLGTLPSILRPLQSFTRELTVISGLAQHGESQGLNAHEHCAFLHLTGAPRVGKEKGKVFAGPSIDQVAARHFADQTLLPSLEIGLTNGETRYSFRDRDLQVPFEDNPRLVFERMFRGRQPVVPNWNRRASNQAAQVQQSAKPDSLQQSVLDLIQEDARSLQNKLGTQDRQRLDEYLTGVREVEKRLAFVEARQRIEAADALNPGPSKLKLPDNLPAEKVPIWKITGPVHADPERHGEYIRLMADLMVLAFQTDTTRVCTFAAGSDEASFPGVVTVGYERHCHTLEHQGNAARVDDADPIAREACRQIHAWYTLLFAEFVARLKGIDEGGSTLLDNTVLLYTSYMADGGHGRDDYPVVLVGKAGGQLTTGRHLALKAKTPMSNLYVEMLNLMGVPTKSFGDSTGGLTALR